MQCEKCQSQEATVHYTEIIEKKSIKINLCEKCAQEKGLDIDAEFSIGDFLGGLTGENNKKGLDPKTACSQCGMTLPEFKKIGRFGCSGCYQSFDSVLEMLMNSIHKKVKHSGKKARKTRKKITVEEKIVRLKEKLDEAVKKEKFEEAAKLRDEITELKKNKNRVGTTQ